MTPQLILIVFILLYIAEFLVSWILSVMNMNSIIQNKDEIPSAFKEYIDNEKYKKSVDYSLSKANFSLITSAWSFVILLVIVLTGFPGKLEQFLGLFLKEGYLFSIIYIFAFSAVF
ncbi:MAG: hypothetical protein PQJ58_16085, partial [Spirochaetales bacterium]|nr:hypothetical protein [Spirochaetales bacterium]